MTSVSTISNFKEYDSEKKVCRKCAPYFYLSKNKCKEVSPFCKTYSEEDGSCLSCYAGFRQEGKDCVF